MNGILLLDKPAGITSNHALQKVKRLFKAKKAGHTGSLDPIATGMLPICFGEATKFSQFLLEADKIYDVTAKLGIQTTTGDIEGAVVATASTAHLTLDLLHQVTARYIGEQVQTPPMFSAIKHQGVPLYELARQGIEVERKARPITIFSLQIQEWRNDEMRLTVHCSKGTYIRTLVEEIGRDAGCGAHVIALRRATVTPYGNATMHTLESLTAKACQDNSSLTACLLPIDTAVHVFPAVKLANATVFYLRMGQSVRAPFPPTSSFVRLFSEDEKFLGLGEVVAGGKIKPYRLLHQNQI